MLSRLSRIVYKISIFIIFFSVMLLIMFVKRDYLASVLFLLVAIIMFLLQTFFNRIAKKNVIPKKININKITNANNNWIIDSYTSYFIPGVIYFIEGEISVSIGVLIGIGCLIILIGHDGLENPILRLQGYKAYEIETAHGRDYLLWSKKEIRNPKTITQVIMISESILMEVD